MTVDFDALAAPFPPDRVSWRIGQMKKGDATKGKALAYLDARDVMGRLDEVCGPGGWQCRYSHALNKTVCDIGVKVGEEWVWKADGAGDSDIEAEKGALSDAFKRAGVRWGIGRYLYDIPSPWVAVNQWKQIEDSEHPRLRGLLKGAATVQTKPVEEPKPQTDSAKPLTLEERANRFEDVLRNTKPADLAKAWAKGSELCAQLDTAMPERLVELEELYKGLTDVAETPFT